MKPSFFLPAYLLAALGLAACLMPAYEIGDDAAGGQAGALLGGAGGQAGDPGDLEGGSAGAAAQAGKSGAAGHSGTTGTGGKAGTAGSAGTAGTAGSGGKGGAGGVGGAAGKGGTSGAAGTAGKSGAAGAAGQAGSSGGSNGACGYSFTNVACGQCADKSCCAQEKTCASDTACNACAIGESTTGCDTNDKLSALKSCLTGPCLSSCPGFCGFTFTTTSCQQCTDSACCGEQSACVDDATCNACFTGQTTTGCASNARYNQLQSCQQKSCQQPCSSG